MGTTLVKFDELTVRFAPLGYEEIADVIIGESVQAFANRYGLEHPLFRAMVRSHDELEQWRDVPPHEWCSTFILDPHDIYFATNIQGGDSGRNVFAIIAAAIITAIAPPVGAALFGAGTIGAFITSTAIIIGGNLLIGQLFQPESPNSQIADEGDGETFRRVESAQNIIARDAFLPIVVGKRDILPYDLTMADIRLRATNQVIRRVFGFWEKHIITNIRADDVPVDDSDNFTVEITDGDPSTTPTTFVDQIYNHRTYNAGIETFDLVDQDLADQLSPENSLPKPVLFTTRGHPKIVENTIRVTITGLYPTDAGATNKVCFPLRIRKRDIGSPTWFNFPEIWVFGRVNTTKEFEIRIREDSEGFGPRRSPSLMNFGYFTEVPEENHSQTSYSTRNGPQWEADDHFSDITLPFYTKPEQSIGGSSFTGQPTWGVVNDADGIRIVAPVGFLSTDVDSEWEITRGLSLDLGAITKDYIFNSAVWSMFEPYQTVTNVWETAKSQNEFPTRVQLSFAKSVANQVPCLKSDITTVGVESVNQSMRQVKMSAAGVPFRADVLTESKNPAVWGLHLIRMFMESHGFDTSLLNTQSWLDWATYCDEMGWEVNTVVGGEETSEALRRCFVAGYAKLGFDRRGISVSYYRNRTSETPSGSISLRNAQSITVTMNDADIPSSIRPIFDDESDNFRENGNRTINSPVPITTQFEESRVIRSMTNFDLIREREIFNLLQAFHRNKLWQAKFNDMSAIVWSVDELVNLVTDLETEQAIGFKVTKVLNPTTLVIDQELRVENSQEFFSTNNVFDLENVFFEDRQGLIFYNTKNGSEMRRVTGVDGRVVRLDAPMTDTDIEGVIGSIGSLDVYSKRCYVAGVQPDENGGGTVILVDEKPEIHEQMGRYFTKWR